MQQDIAICPWRFPQPVFACECKRDVRACLFETGGWRGCVSMCVCDVWRGQSGGVREDGIFLKHSSPPEPEASPEDTPPADEEPAASSAAPAESAEPSEPTENGVTTESSAEQKEEEEGAEKKEWVSRESRCVCARACLRPWMLRYFTLIALLSVYMILTSAGLKADCSCHGSGVAFFSFTM